MISRSTWLHLRVAFSFFLLPVFLFALSASADVQVGSVFLVFVILHFFLYPASNGYNSYFDKDEDSIGGLEKPPTVTPDLYYVAIGLDVIAISLGLLISWEFAVMVFIYGLVSKAYSHPAIRLKKYPFVSWFIAGLFQGFFTFLMAYLGINNLKIIQLADFAILFPALLTSVMLWGSYPMTQIYQHEEDTRRGDITLSIKLGISGTFYFTALIFLLSVAGFMVYYTLYHSFDYALLYVAFLLPVLFYFIYWLLLVLKDKRQADFHHTMRLNMISALCLNLFFAFMFYINNQ